MVIQSVVKNLLYALVFEIGSMIGNNQIRNYTVKKIIFNFIRGLINNAQGRVSTHM